MHNKTAGCLSTLWEKQFCPSVPPSVGPLATCFLCLKMMEIAEKGFISGIIVPGWIKWWWWIVVWCMVVVVVARWNCSRLDLILVVILVVAYTDGHLNMGPQKLCVTQPLPPLPPYISDLEIRRRRKLTAHQKSQNHARSEAKEGEEEKLRLQPWPWCYSR